ncbi:MAG: hypothetical protein A2987_02140 [Omnitrophica bacterium RIFCSPLOWO2_01_FULL_45_10]|nr:MAG: hypothetical protein A2987_02140 [Omnitrophica bacterium RIFCSPLOWO2_01_FULL_45_10]
MRKRLITALAVIIFTCLTAAYGQEEKEKSATPAAIPTFAVVLGTVSGIDSKDPSKPILEVKSDVDNQIHTIETAPWTNVVKVTDITELKAGDTVRVMTRKIEGNEIAMNITFGKIKSAPLPMPLPPRPAPEEKVR